MSLENTVMALARHVQMLEERLARTEKQAALMGVFGDRPSSTDSVVDVARLERGSTGTAADGIGVGLPFFVQDASGNIDEAASIDAVLTTAAHATQAAELRLGVMGTTRAWLTSNGYLSIGDAFSYGGHLNVAKEGSNYPRLVVLQADNGEAYYPLLDLRKAQGTIASPSALDSANSIYGALLFSGRDDAGFHTAAEIRGSADGTPGSGTDMPGKLGFYTTPAGSATAVITLWLRGNGDVEGRKAMLTAEGGFAVKLVAQEALTAGEVVQAGTADGKVVKNAVNSDMPLGVVYATAAQDADVWVVVAGLASVLPEAANTLAQGDIIYSSNATAGRVDNANSLPSVEMHNREIGHCVVDGTGAGAAALCVIHWN